MYIQEQIQVYWCGIYIKEILAGMFINVNLYYNLIFFF
jgi:hypothetical protein